MAALMFLSRSRRSIYSLSVLFPYRNSHQPFLNPDRLFECPPIHSPPPSFFSPRGSFSSISDESRSRWLGPSSDVVLNEVACGAADDSSLPVITIISLLDGVHHLTGLPWWMVIVSSTVGFRLALLPLLISQLKKLKRISEVFPKLPPPFPPPSSGKSFVDQFSHFWKESQAIGCPSFLWFLPYIVIQVPCFFLLMTSIRKMSLDSHPGFDYGGAVWFQNLTALPHGVFGSIFPILIASLHYINVQISFEASSIRQTSGLIGFLAKFYKLYLDFLSLPLLVVGYFIPQGSLIYWVTNSSLTVIQQLSLRNPAVAAKLGLLDRDASVRAEDSAQTDTAELKYLDSLSKDQTISIQMLTPEELLALSVQLLSKGDMETAIHLLQLALDKDPWYVRGLVLIGQALLQEMLLTEATEYLERAISKLLDGHHLSEIEDLDLLMLASQWAGAAYVQQGKMAEGITHLERVAKLKEPEDRKSKAHYFDTLLVLASALYKEGRTAEAAKFLRLVVAYNPAYGYLLEQCNNNDSDLVNDLVSSWREKY